jgi:hypothetical protein
MNYMKGGADVKLGEDKDYPDWLWTLDPGHKVGLLCSNVHCVRAAAFRLHGPRAGWMGVLETAPKGGAPAGVAS